MAYLEVGDGRLYYEHHHRGGALTVLLSHGFGMSLRAWDDVTAALTDAGYDVLAYDHRGCGQSDKDFSDVSVETQGSDIVALCDAAGVDRVVLNGWSLGGALVVDAAGKLGDRVAGLISTCGATPRYTQAEGFEYGGQAADVAATVAALRADRTNFLRGLYFEGVFAAEVSEAVKTHSWHIAMQASPAADAALGALADVDQRETMAGLSCPGLFVVGEADGVVAPDIGRAGAAMMPNASVLEMAGCGHAPFLEDAETYRSAILAFLAGL